MSQVVACAPEAAVNGYDEGMRAGMGWKAEIAELGILAPVSNSNSAPLAFWTTALCSQAAPSRLPYTFRVLTAVLGYSLHYFPAQITLWGQCHLPQTSRKWYANPVHPPANSRRAGSFNQNRLNFRRAGSALLPGHKGRTMPLAAVVSDDTEFVIQVSQILDARGWATLTTRESTALASIKRERPGLIIFDVRGDRSEPSWVLLDLLRKEESIGRVPILVSSRSDRELRDNVIRMEGLRVIPLPRPFDAAQFGAAMDQLVSA